MLFFRWQNQNWRFWSWLYLTDKKPSENILACNICILYLWLLQHFCIRFDKANGFDRVYDETRYFAMFGDEKYGFIYNRIRYLMGVKSGITYVISHNYAKINIDSYDSLPIEKTLTLHNVVMLVKSVFNKDKNNCYYKTFWEKCSYELPKNNNNE